MEKLFKKEVLLISSLVFTTNIMGPACMAVDYTDLVCMADFMDLAYMADIIIN